MYRVARLRCPTLSIQPWLKTLADLHGTAFRPYSTQQFSTCFDVYLEILKNVDDRVKKALGRDAPDWRLKNGCPACTYKLEGEMKLIFEMLVTMDGNDSLKRVLTKEKGAVDENGTAKRGGTERADPRTADAGGTYFLSREKVNQFTKELLAQFTKAPVRIHLSRPWLPWKTLTHTRGATIQKRIQSARSGGRTCQRSSPHVCGESLTRPGFFSACVGMALFY
jgi:hypothetical protein